MTPDDGPGTRSLTSIAFQHLRSDILFGRLRPNARLKVRALSNRYQIGTTAIREALSRLVADGFVDAEEQRGFSVVAVSRDELLDLTETRVHLEALALTKAIELGDVQWESTVLGAFHRLSKEQDPALAVQQGRREVAHRQFHQSLIAGCGSPSLLRMCGELCDKCERYRNLAERHTSPGDRDTVKEHRDIMESAVARDGAAAVAHMTRHLRMTTGIILASGLDALSI